MLETFLQVEMVMIIDWLLLYLSHVFNNWFIQYFAFKDNIVQYKWSTSFIYIYIYI